MHDTKEGQDSEVILAVDQLDNHHNNDDCKVEVTMKLEESLENEQAKKEEDAWKTIEDNSPKWAELDTKGKVIYVATAVGKAVSLLIFLYFFICSLDIMSDAFLMVGGKATSTLFRDADLLQNPIIDLMIGIILTILVQSSSTSSSIIVSVVAAGMLDVEVAVYMIMGVNVGTSITNTIVSLGHVGDKEEFRRAFAGATIHDMFNWLTVITLFIIELISGYLYHLTDAIAHNVGTGSSVSENVNFLKVLTEPFTNLIIQIDKDIQQAWTLGPNQNDSHMNELYELDSMRKTDCDGEPCKYLFMKANWSDLAIGLVLLLIALVTLFVCLYGLVKILKSVLQGSISNVIKKLTNSDLPYVPWLTGYVAMLAGCGFTILVQSSSVFTSALTPLAGLGVISLERMYPLCLGANIGTTTTALLAALTADESHMHLTIQVALCHLFFNITGIIIFYVVPFMRFPIPLARKLGDITAEYKWFAIVYMIGMFAFVPAFIFLISLGGAPTLLGVGLPCLIVLVFATVVNVMQNYKPNWLPPVLRTWNWLPIWLHSFGFYDRLFAKIGCCRCLQKKDEKEETEEVEVVTDKQREAEGLDNPTFQGDQVNT